MYCIFPSCIRFAILISLSNSNVSAAAEKKKMLIGKKKGSYLETGELPQKVIQVIHAGHSSIITSNNTECFSEG